ncbi:hypothetical protein [Nonomuraea rhizosphaerae]|uniref:hypothetical protein n=1 Tax=Nonomuraea rhizosphaerae TaxID=2665663 RepID=UPI001C5D13B6|nr:hypothetical protein [Nonomuraea rhizosphaerae]
MSGRHVHLVGSYPAADARQAMTIMAEVAGPHLTSLPDGEVGPRRQWITHILDALRVHPDVELRKDGDWSGYDTRPVFRVKRGHPLTAASLHLGHAAAAAESYEIFHMVREQYSLNGLSFQVGIPGDLDLALFAFGPASAMTRRRAFRDALTREIKEIAGWAGQDVLFQIEVPAELVMVATVPAPLRTLVARRLVSGMIKQVTAASPGTRFGVHLCVGDLNNKALKRPATAAPVVSMVDALVRAWPEGRPLEYVHVPLAAGDEPPPLRTAFYKPLESLAALPGDIKFAAGLAHESQEPGDQRKVLRIVEDLLSRTVDVSPACGLGRRSPEAARRVLERAVTLAES